MGVKLGLIDICEQIRFHCFQNVDNVPFFDTPYRFRWEKIFELHLHFLQILNENKGTSTFSDILQKVKTYFLPIAIILDLNSIEIPKKYYNDAPLVNTSTVF
jgi:hypothetical protein